MIFFKNQQKLGMTTVCNFTWAPGYDTAPLTTPLCHGVDAGGQGNSRLHAGLCPGKQGTGRGVFRGFTEAATAMKAEGIRAEPASHCTAHTLIMEQP